MSGLEIAWRIFIGVPAAAAWIAFFVALYAFLTMPDDPPPPPFMGDAQG